jgi:DNA-binding XRE family transcriptional regulator
MLMEFDKSKSVQLLNLAGGEYVLVQKDKYDQLLDKLEALDTALDVARSGAEASQDLLSAVLRGSFTIEQIRELSRTKTLGHRLRVLREIRKLDQRELARKTGMSQTTISNLENDKVSEPSYASLDAIIEVLGLPDRAVYPFLKSLKSRG